MKNEFAENESFLRLAPGIVSDAPFSEQFISNCTVSSFLFHGDGQACEKVIRPIAGYTVNREFPLLQYLGVSKVRYYRYRFSLTTNYGFVTRKDFLKLFLMPSGNFYRESCYCYFLSEIPDDLELENLSFNHGVFYNHFLDVVIKRNRPEAWTEGTEIFLIKNNKLLFYE